MKKNILIRPILLFSLTLSLIGCFGDTEDDPKPSCTAQSSSELTSVNVFDGTVGSAYYNTAIANFKLSQATQIYPNNCQVNTYGSTSLKITNTIAKTETLSYRISVTVGVLTWQYQDVATIAPNTTVDVGVISANPQRVNIGTVLIQLASISYK